tara:strand:+ start:194 stop:613 length:420 start_codon:yes stop_codon:yes gene_type:complete
MGAKKEQGWEEYFEQILDKLNHMEFRGDVQFGQPNHINATNMSVSANLTREGEKFKLPPPEPEVPEPMRKLTETDWLNMMNYYKMLLDGFKGAQWDKDSVREQIASVMIRKTKKFFEDNYPDLIEQKKRPIFDKEDFIK